MLFNNVRETSTSTGTGNIIVNGASENGVRFDDAVPLNVHFSLFVDYGSGERIQYLTEGFAPVWQFIFTG